MEYFQKLNSKDGRKVIYSLTSKGLNLIPILVELANWGVLYNPKTPVRDAWIKQVTKDKEELIKMIRETVITGGSVFRGKENVLGRLEQIYR